MSSLGLFKNYQKLQLNTQKDQKTRVRKVSKFTGFGKFAEDWEIYIKAQLVSIFLEVLIQFLKVIITSSDDFCLISGVLKHP